MGPKLTFEVLGKVQILLRLLSTYSLTRAEQQIFFLSRKAKASLELPEARFHSFTKLMIIFCINFVRPSLSQSGLLRK